MNKLFDTENKLFFNTDAGGKNIYQCLLKVQTVYIQQKLMTFLLHWKDTRSTFNGL